MDLYQVCSNYAPDAKNWSHPLGHMFNIGIYGGNMKILLSEILDIWCVATPSEPLANLFKLCHCGGGGGKMVPSWNYIVRERS